MVVLAGVLETGEETAVDGVGEMATADPAAGVMVPAAAWGEAVKPCSRADMAR